MARTFLVVLLLWLPLVCSSGVRPLLIVGCSMNPSLQSGQLVLLHQDYYRTHALTRGDVVVFRWKGHVYVKRVAALAGERVRFMCADGYCSPVEKSAEERVNRLIRTTSFVSWRTWNVPEGHFFSLGDNLSASIDSRELGPIPLSAVIGRVQRLRDSGLTRA